MHRPHKALFASLAYRQLAIVAVAMGIHFALFCVTMNPDLQTSQRVAAVPEYVATRQFLSKPVVVAAVGKQLYAMLLEARVLVPVLESQFVAQVDVVAAKVQVPEVVEAGATHPP